jgi:hypothetical protein
MRNFEAAKETTGKYNLYTGIGTVLPLALNPTNEEYAKIAGRELPFTLSYEPYEDGKIPNKLLVKEITSGNLYFITLFSSKDVATTKAGDKFIFVNKSYRYTSWVDDPKNVNEKMNYDATDCRKSFTGEEIIMMFIKNVIGYKQSLDKAFEEQFKDATDFVWDDKAFLEFFTKGKVKFINSIFEKLNQFGTAVTFAIKNTGNGFKQDFIINKDTIFYVFANQAEDGKIVYNIPKSAFTNLEKYLERQTTAGYPYKGDVTIKFQIHDPNHVADINNDVDVNASDDDLPF